MRFGRIRTAFARLFSACSCKRSNHSQTHGYESCRVDAVGESSRPECRTDGTKEIKSMPPPQPTDEVRRFFFGSFFFASLSHIRPHGLQTHTRSPLGVVCMCVAINTTSPNPVTPRTMPSSQPTPSLAANHSKCQTSSRMRTRPFIPDTRHRPSTARVSPSALHRISVSVLFRFYISYFRFGFGFIISARQRTLTNTDECTIRIRQFPTPLAQCRVGHCDAPSTGKGMSR